jgi:hypothetical protein
MTGEDVGGDQPDPASRQHGAHLRVGGLGVIGEAARHLGGHRPGRTRRVADLDRLGDLPGRPHPGAPRARPSALDQTGDLADDLGHVERRRRGDGVDQIDVVEPHPTQRAVELGGGVLRWPVLPPQFVGHGHFVTRPSRGPEQFAEHHLGVAGRDRRLAGLVVVAGVVEEVDAGVAGGPQHGHAVVPGDPLERAPRSERHDRDVDARPAQRPVRQRHVRRRHQ